MTDRTELRRLLEEATPRPWEAIIFDSGHSKFEFEASVCTQDVGDSICRMDGLLRTADNERYRTDGSLDALLIAAAVNALPSLLDQLDAAEAALARVRELHEHWPIHGDGDHPEDCDCGDPWVTVCRLCCTDGKDQHETCAAYHDHGPDKPICPTIAALGGEQS